MTSKLRIGALISGGGTNLQAVIDACEEGRITGQIVFIGSDNPSAYGLKRAHHHDIPSFVVDYATIIREGKKNPQHFTPPDDFDCETVFAQQALFQNAADPKQAQRFLTTRAIAEAQLLHHMQHFSFDLLILAGFMRTLTPYFINRVNIDPNKPKIMNIHPALLPAFPGVDGYGDTFRYGCKVGGCTVHFIDYGEDSGPIIGQKAFPILPEDDLETVKKKGLQKEWELYPECIQLFAENRLQLITHSQTEEGGQPALRTVVKITTSSP